ncbi:DUF3575 domain-containing protein [Cloacibacterium sp.]|uniref:DUF3575 domain-containing protein n=1 Tax=Cloacibacterium sp. TaxID=1913682 RepID=UPI0039E5D135
MKKLFLSCALALFGVVNAQQNSVKFNPLAVFGGANMFSYERAVSEHSAVGVGVGFSSYKITDVEYNSIAGSLFYRYYFSEVLKRWYATGGVSYYSGKVKYDGDKDNYGSFAINGKFGYQWVWDSGFTLDLSGGLVYRTYTYDANSPDTSVLKASGIGPAFGFGLGYTW